ncbi:MAG: hypothetical protein AAF762_15425, partial [Pseudomonadota bacterium]
MGNFDLDADDEGQPKGSEAVADDTGEVNPTRVTSSRASGGDADPFDADPTQPIHPRAEEPEEAEGAGWGTNAFSEDSWDDDEDWGDDEDVATGLDELAEKVPGEADMRDAVSDAAEAAPAAMPSRVIRSRPAAASLDPLEDGPTGRRAIARSRIGSQVEGAEDRLMSETNNQFTDTESTRRRSAMAHLKRAAAATKADKVLSHVVGRDAASDPEEQSPYRDDLAKVVRPRSGSRPISRPVSKDSLIAEPWDEGTSDIDAAMFAAASEQSLAPEDTGVAHGMPAQESAAEEPAPELTDAGPAEAEDRFTAHVAPQPASAGTGDERVTSVTGGSIDESSSFD